MNLRAKCTNEGCKAFNIEKSVAVGKLTGYGAPNDRVKCPACGKLMTTTETGDPSRIRPTPRRDTGRRITQRAVGRRTSAKRTKRRSYKRNSGRS